jgi:hypothetical protein
LGSPRGDRGVEVTAQRENTQGGAPMDGAESGLWGMALKSEGESFVGRNQMGVAEPCERRISLMQPAGGAEPPSWLG